MFWNTGALKGLLFGDLERVGFAEIHPATPSSFHKPFSARRVSVANLSIAQRSGALSGISCDSSAYAVVTELKAHAHSGSPVNYWFMGSPVRH